MGERRLPPRTAIRRRAIRRVLPARFDVYAPTTGSVRNVYEAISRKVREDQAHRVIVNLDGTTVTPSQLRKYLLENPIDRLKEFKVVYQGKISTLFPFRN
jgi:hypothetical protein